MRTTLFLLFSLALFSSCQSTTKTKTDDPRSLILGSKKITFEALSALISEKELPVNEPYGDSEEIMAGFPLHLILDSFMGEVWRDLDGVVLVAKDGYKVDIPVSKILRYKPLLAYRYTNNKPFVVHKKDRDVELSPYYLVWDNLKISEIKKADHKHWPFQVIRIYLVRYQSQHASNKKFIETKI